MCIQTQCLSFRVNLANKFIHVSTYEFHVPYTIFHAVTKTKMKVKIAYFKREVIECGSWGPIATRALRNGLWIKDLVSSKICSVERYTLS